MQIANKVILNTIILYTKILISLVISFWAMSLVLAALGTSDFGLYNLVAGVIVMFTFLNSAMSSATQRYMSVTMGSKDTKQLNSIYNISIVLHLLIGLIIVVVFEICGLFIFDGFLNIPSDRILAAKWIYQFLVVSTFFTIIAVPFDAVMNSYENMLAYSLISIVETILKLFLAFLLFSTSSDKLIFYGLGITIIAVLGVIIRIIYVNFKYPNLSVHPKIFISKPLFIEMFSFAGWNILGSFANVARNQGVAVILNLFYGVIVNAAYGIANQINGGLSYFSSTIQKSINPQLMKSTGMKDEERLTMISFISTKVCVLILGMLVIPIIIEMPFILDIWLDEVPEYSVSFSRLVLLLSLITQYSVGNAAAIMSSGNIKKYQITMTLLYIINIPIIYIMMKIGFAAYYSIIVLIIIESIAFIVRLIFAKKIVQIPIESFIKTIITPTIITFIIVLGCLIIITELITSSLIRVIVISFISFLVSLILSWLIIFSKKEKEYFINFVKSYIK